MGKKQKEKGELMKKLRIIFGVLLAGFAWGSVAICMQSLSSSTQPHILFTADEIKKSCIVWYTDKGKKNSLATIDWNFEKPIYRVSFLDGKRVIKREDFVVDPFDKTKARSLFSSSFKQALILFELLFEKPYWDYLWSDRSSDFAKNFNWPTTYESKQWKEFPWKETWKKPLVSLVYSLIQPGSLPKKEELPSPSKEPAWNGAQARMYLVRCLATLFIADHNGPVKQLKDKSFEWTIEGYKTTIKPEDNAVAITQILPGRKWSRASFFYDKKSDVVSYRYVIYGKTFVFFNRPEYRRVALATNNRVIDAHCKFSLFSSGLVKYTDVYCGPIPTNSYGRFFNIYFTTDRIGIQHLVLNQFGKEKGIAGDGEFFAETIYENIEKEHWLKKKDGELQEYKGFNIRYPFICVRAGASAPSIQMRMGNVEEMLQKKGTPTHVLNTHVTRSGQTMWNWEQKKKRIDGTEIQYKEYVFTNAIYNKTKIFPYASFWREGQRYTFQTSVAVSPAINAIWREETIVGDGQGLLYQKTFDLHCIKDNWNLPESEETKFIVTVEKSTKTVKKKETFKYGPIASEISETIPSLGFKPAAESIEYQLDGGTSVTMERKAKEASREYLNQRKISEDSMKNWDTEMSKLKREYGISKPLYQEVIDKVVIFKNYFSKFFPGSK